MSIQQLQKERVPSLYPSANGTGSTFEQGNAFIRRHIEFDRYFGM
jgi:hypothetical protein